jgi:hypothetical protein
VVVLVQHVVGLGRRLVEAMPGGRTDVLDAPLDAAVADRSLGEDLDSLGGLVSGQLLATPRT